MSPVDEFLDTWRKVLLCMMVVLIILLVALSLSGCTPTGPVERASRVYTTDACPDWVIRFMSENPESAEGLVWNEPQKKQCVQYGDYYNIYTSYTDVELQGVVYAVFLGRTVLTRTPENKTDFQLFTSSGMRIQDPYGVVLNGGYYLRPNPTTSADRYKFRMNKADPSIRPGGAVDVGLLIVSGAWRATNDDVK